MPRQARIVVPGAGHHVTQRGNYQRDVFFTPGDRRVYLELLRESADEYGLRIIAYCLMTNHVHIVAIPETQDALSKAMGRAAFMYSQHIHQHTARHGHLWQGRFYSNPMDDVHAWNAAAYVELNPLRANIARAPWEYLWSSAATHCGKGEETVPILGYNKFWEGVRPHFWVDTLRQFSRDIQRQDEIRSACRNGKPLGGQQFLRKVAHLSGRRVSSEAARPKDTTTT